MPQLLERETELARIDGRLGAARRGAGSLVVVEGPAGIGKTAIMRSARDAAVAADMRVLHGRGVELERPFAHGVLRQALERPLAALAPEVRHAVFSGQARHAAALLDPAAPAVSAETVLQGIHWLLVNLAELSPVLLAVDDAHWSDEPTLDALAFLAPRLEQLPVVLLLATRPPDIDAQPRLAGIAADPVAEVLRPQPLGAEAVAAISTSSDLAFVTAALEATGGNPFLLDELLRALGPVRSAVAVAALEPRELARGVLARLSAPARDLVRAAEVLREDATLAACTELSGAGATALRELVAAGLLSDGDPLRFRHPLVLAAVRASVPAAERRAWQARAVTVLRGRGAGAERIALHLLETEPCGDSRAVHELADAAAAARRRGAPAAAGRLLRRALAEPPEPNDRPRLLLALGETLTLTGDRSAVDVLSEAARTSDDPVLRASALEAHAWALGPGHSALTLDELDEAAAELPDDAAELRHRLEAIRLVIAADDSHLLAAALARAERLGLFDARGPRHPDLLAHAARLRMLRGERPRPAHLSRAVPPRRAFPAVPSTPTASGFRSPASSCALPSCWTMGSPLPRPPRRPLERGDPRLGSRWPGCGALTSWRRPASWWRQRPKRGSPPKPYAGREGWLTHLPAAGLAEILVQRGDADGARTAWAAGGVPEQIPPGRPMTVLLFSRGLCGRSRATTRARCGPRGRRATSGRHRAALHERPGRAARARPPSPTRGNLDRAGTLADQALAIAESWGTPRRHRNRTTGERPGAR
jgi:hypothetical protein